MIAHCPGYMSSGTAGLTRHAPISPLPAWCWDRRTYRSSRPSKVKTTEGTLDDWPEVAALADGNPVMIFALSTQFASPTIALQRAEGNAIIHFVAASSTGKTTVLRAGA